MADTNQLVQWVLCTSEQYKAAKLVEGKIEDRKLYFLSDTKELYRGTVPYTESVVLFEDGARPTIGAQGKLYVNSLTLEGSVYNGTAWVTVIQSVSATVIDATSGEATTKPVSGAAVKAYVDTVAGTTLASCVTNITYDADNKAIKFTKDGADTSVPLTKVATNIAYDGSTGVISLKDSEDTVLSTVNIPLDNFVTDGSYDATKKALVLSLQNGTSVEIPAEDLVQLYNELDSSTVDITIGTDANGNNTIKADVKVSTQAGNSIVVKEDGLFVEAPTGKMDKLAVEKVGEVVIADATGNASASGVKIGTATLAETPNATTLATEAAVNAIKTGINTLADETYVKLSDVIASYDELNTTDPSAQKVVSEKAFKEALEWKTIE